MILYEDKDLIVCHKPAGVPVQSARIGQKDMVSILNNYLAEAAVSKLASGKRKNLPESQPQTVFVVHRLDQPVEGVIVFAKSKRAASELGKQITDGSMKKIYRAVCCVTEGAEREFSDMTKQYHCIDYLVKNGRTNTSSVSKRENKDAKKAELFFQILAERSIGHKKYWMTEVELKTGRHHQIRVQMANAKLPLYGDQKYHTAWKEYLQRGQMSLALCAVSLSFRHPATKKEVCFETQPQSEIFHIFS